MTNRWLIWSNEQLGWWKPDRQGYTPYLELAGRYSLADAAAIVAAALGGTVPAVDELGAVTLAAPEVMVLALDGFDDESVRFLELALGVLDDESDEQIIDRIARVQRAAEGDSQ